MDFRVIVTLGPSIHDAEKLAAIHALGPCVYRINGAHASGEDVVEKAALVRDILPDAVMMVDLPGNKVRISHLEEPIRLVKGESFCIHSHVLNYGDFYKHVSVGDKVLANDSIYTLEVETIDGTTVRLKSHSDGLLTRGKGLHIRGMNKDIPFVFSKDMELMEACSQVGIEYVGISFVRTADDIREIRGHLSRMGCDAEIIAKVETKAAVDNLDGILEEARNILVDRGDLSTDVGLLELSSYQERIVERAKERGNNIYLATQFLKNMERYPVPLIAEVIDLHKTLKAGVQGIQLSEETAVGSYPVECVRNVFALYNNL